MQTVTYQQLYSKWCQAITAFGDYVDELNEINFFPVSDFDTGTNMFDTLKCAMDMTEDIQQFPRNVVRCSKGNSGMLLGQMVYGFLTVVQQEGLSDTTVKKAIQRATELSYKAILRPKEGTMLTFVRLLSQIEDWNNVTERNQQIEQALNATLKNGEYDAGAKGLYYLVNLIFHLGLQSRIAKGVVPQEQLQLTFNFCTETALENFSQSNLQSVLQFLESKGDSVNYSLVGNGLKTHVHTNNPFEIINFLKLHGNVAHVKIDNMEMESIIRPTVTVVVDAQGQMEPFPHAKCEYICPLNVAEDVQHLLNVTHYSDHVILLTDRPNYFNNVLCSKLHVVQTFGYVSQFVALTVKQYANFDTYLQDVAHAASCAQSVYLQDCQIDEFLAQNPTGFVVSDKTEGHQQIIGNQKIVLGVKV